MFPAGVQRHHKGGLFRVLFEAVESTNERAGADLVVYVSLTTGRIHVRELVEFIQPVIWPDGQVRPRFVPKDSP